MEVNDRQGQSCPFSFEYDGVYYSHNYMNDLHETHKTFENRTLDTAEQKMQKLKAKRLSANARERKRMNKINSGYDRLREVLPTMHGSQLSKMEALQMACSYIVMLDKMLKQQNNNTTEF